MYVAVTEHGAYTEVAARGRLNLVGASALQTAVEEALRLGGRRLVINMGGIDFMDPAGLGSLLCCLKAARERGGELRISNVTPLVRTVLDLTGTARVLMPDGTMEHSYAEC